MGLKLDKGWLAILYDLKQKHHKYHWLIVLHILLWTAILCVHDNLCGCGYLQCLHAFV